MKASRCHAAAAALGLVLAAASPLRAQEATPPGGDGDALSRLEQELQALRRAQAESDARQRALEAELDRLRERARSEPPPEAAGAQSAAQRPAGASGEPDDGVVFEGFDDEGGAGAEAEAEAEADGGDLSLADRVTLVEDTLQQQVELTARVLLGGYAQIIFEDLEREKADFSARRVIIFVGSQIHERLRFTSEIEFEFGGTPFKTDVPGVNVPGEVKLEQAYLDFLVRPEIAFRAGVLLIPFGWFNLNHDPPLQDFTTRPIVDTSIIPTTWFDVGAGFFGRVDAGPIGLTYEAYLFNGLGDEIFDGFGTSLARNFDQPPDNNDDKAFVARVVVTPPLPRGLGGLDAGFSVFTGKWDDEGDERITMLALDLFYSTGDLGHVLDGALRLGPVELVGEGVLAYLDDGANALGQPVPTRMEGLWAETRFHLWPAALNDTFLGAGFAEPTFTLAARYAVADTNTDVTTAAGDRRVWSFALNYRPVEGTVLGIEYHVDADGRDGGAVQDDGFVASFSSFF